MEDRNRAGIWGKKNEPRLRQLYWVTAASTKAGARSGS